MNLSPTPATIPATIPFAAGVGLKPQHFEVILETNPQVAWFEVHPENYLVEGGPLLHHLNQIRQLYPLSFHSVGMSLGSNNLNAEGVNSRNQHLSKLKELIQRYQPGLVSDHLSWSHWHNTNFNDLLPIPYSENCLAIFCENIDRAQTILGRQIAIENPSNYLQVKDRANQHEQMDECDFLITLAKRSGASILLDINNIYVSAHNQNINAKDYIEKLPQNLISEIHLAGHSRKTTDLGELLIDDHGSTVCDEVWHLYQFSLDHLGKKPTLIEWDTDVPSWTTLQKEANKANVILNSSTDFILPKATT